MIPSRPLVALLVVASVASTAAAAQVNEVERQLAPGRLFGFQGEISTFGELYGISGRDPRRPSSTARLIGRSTISVTRHVNVGLDFLLSTEGSGFGTGAGSSTLGSSRQQINQLGITPTWSWGKVYLGTFTDSYTPLSFSGVRVTGAGASLNPGIVRFAVFGGQARTAVFGGATDGSYRRGITGGKIGVGRDDASFLDVVFVRARDDEHSLPSDSTAFIDPRLEDPTVDPDTLAVGTVINPLAVTPQENVVAALAGRLFLLDRKLELTGELGGSGYSRDVRASPIDNDAVLDEFPGFVRGLITPRISSTFGLAYTAQAHVRLARFSGSASYKSIAPGYVSLGVGSLLNDLRAWELSGTQRFGRRTTLRLDAARQHDNLLGQKEATTTRNRYGAVLTARPRPRWTASVRGNFIRMQNDLSAGNDSRIAYDNWIFATQHTVSLGRDRLLRSVGVGYTYRNAGDENPKRQASSFKAHTANARVVLAPSRVVSVTPSLGLVRSWPAGAGEWQLRETYGLAAQVRALDGRWTTSASVGSSQSGTVSVLQTRLTSRYRLTAADVLTLTLRGSGYRNAPHPLGTPGDFQELTVNLQLTHRFGGDGGSPGDVP